MRISISNRQCPRHKTETKTHISAFFFSISSGFLRYRVGAPNSRPPSSTFSRVFGFQLARQNSFGGIEKRSLRRGASPIIVKSTKRRVIASFGWKEKGTFVNAIFCYVSGAGSQCESCEWFLHSHTFPFARTTYDASYHLYGPLSPGILGMSGHLECICFGFLDPKLSIDIVCVHHLSSWCFLRSKSTCLHTVISVPISVPVKRSLYVHIALSFGNISRVGCYT